MDVAQVALVNGTMAEAALIGTLIDDHGVLHVIAGIRDDGDDSVCSTWTDVKVIVEMLLRPDERLLREKESIDLVVHPVWMSMVRRTHCLLGHLTLIHVSWRLVVVAEGDRRRDDREHIDWFDLLMGRVWSDIFFKSSDRECELLERSDPLDTSLDKVLDWAHEARNL